MLGPVDVDLWDVVLPWYDMKTKRAGKTEKLSISLDVGDVAQLKRRAARLYGGNLSAAVAEGIRRVREEEGREALVKWLGAAGMATDAERRAIVAAWATKRRRSAA